MAENIVSRNRPMVNLSGQRFGRWLVVKEFPRIGQCRQWLCKCDCGTESRIYHTNLTCGKSKSCGCLSRDLASTRNRTHGMRHTRIYNVWYSMIRRCEDETDSHYDDYGGRGIKVCERWHDFSAFWEDIKDIYKPDLTIDRKDNNGNYEPGNIRFADRKTQSNNRRSNLNVTINGVTMNIMQWAEKTGIDATVIYARIDLGWDLLRAVVTPVFQPRRIAAYGMLLTIQQWQERTGVNTKTIRFRIAHGWPAEKAVSTPPKHSKAH